MKIGILCKVFDNYSNTRIAEEARKKGHEIIFIDYINCDLEISHDESDIIYNGESLKKLDAVIPRIGIQNNFYGMAVLRQFEAMGVYTLNGSLAIGRARDKLRTLQILAKKNLPFPRSAISNQTLNSERLIEMLGGAPVVIKLTEGLQGVGIVLAETAQSATSIIEAFSLMKTNMILQEYIKESKGADTRVFIIGGKVAGTMERVAKEGEFRSNLHRGGSSRKVKIDAKVKEIAVTAAKEFNLEIAGIDIINSDEGPLILEVNACPGLEGIERTTEKNIALSLIEHLEKNVELHRIKRKQEAL